MSKLSDNSPDSSQRSPAVRPPLSLVAGGGEFRRRLAPLKRSAVFRLAGWQVWCGAAVRTSDGLYHLLFSRWPAETHHNGWVTHSEIGYAWSSSALGPYRFSHVALAGSGGDRWDANVTHNPTILEYRGKYYLYYMGNHGNGEYWNNRNNQRIGVAVADHPSGPWKRMDHPVLDVTPGAWDCLMVSNPTVTRGPDGRFCMVYKGVGAGPMPKGGAVNCGVAFADHPLGPFIKHPTPIITNPENDWAVEDPFVWFQDGKYRCLVKDFQGYFARSEKHVLVLFESQDGIHWKPANDPLVLTRQIVWEDGQTQRVEALERPQIWFENDKPAGLLLACAFDSERNDSANVVIRFSE